MGVQPAASPSAPSLQPSFEERRSVEAAVERCLGSIERSWRAGVSPSGALARWWVVELCRGDRRLRRSVFVDAAKPDLQREVCRRVGEVVPGACAGAESQCAAPEQGDVEIELGAAVPAALARRFEAGLSAALRARGGTFRVLVQAGRKQGEVVVFVGSPQRRAPLPLYFPEAHAMGADDVERIVANVLQAMGPAFAT